MTRSLAPRLAAVALLASAVGLAAAAGAPAGPFRYRTLGTGSSFFVAGTPVACETGKVKGGVALSCLDRNAKTNDVYRESVGAAMIGGGAARVALIDYGKDGKNIPFWERNQPHHPASGLFAAGKKYKGLVAHVGDRLAIGGTAILCVVATGNDMLCVVMKPKTLYAVTGTYGIFANATTMEIGRVNPKGGFDSVKAFDETKIKH
jgi:hypothetical protein